MQALLRTCTALVACAHPMHKRSRYRIVPTRASAAHVEVERCKACGALLLPGGRLEEWERPELVEQLAGEIGPETFAMSSEILDAATAATQVILLLETLVSLSRSGSFTVDTAGLESIVDTMRVWHAQCEQLVAKLVTARVRGKGRA